MIVTQRAENEMRMMSAIITRWRPAQASALDRAVPSASAV